VRCAVVLALVLAGCAELPKPPSAPAPAPGPTEPRLASAEWDDLPGWRDGDPAAAWSAFLLSCRAVGTKAEWQAPCADAARLDAPDAAAVRVFFESRFRPYRAVGAAGADSGLLTGYYEPLVNAARQRSGRFRYPAYGPPPDLVAVDLGAVAPEAAKLKLRGRVDGRRLVPYWTRAQIESRPSPLAGRELVWIDDPIDLFFLHVQGSGRARLPDGTVVRLAFADVNGHPYTSIGKRLIERGELKPGEASAQAIRAWGQRNPAKLQELLNENARYVFFREEPASDAGPKGALGVPLTPGGSIAVDPAFVPLGAPVYIASSWPGESRPLNRLTMAQDTGGAIKGPVRADFFWGFGPEAGELAGRTMQPLAMWVLLPVGAGN
jgi:membrane-bound lytic murein transglycosylase A